MSQDPKDYFFELPTEGRPNPHYLYQFWYPGVQSSWAGSTSPRAHDPIFGVQAVVIHATAGSSSFGAMSVMKGGGASWHWLVPDENEKAYGKFAWACAPEARAAWHVQNSKFHPRLNGGRKRINHWSLGIEVVNAQSETDTFSDWQLKKTAEIVRYAWAKYPNLKYVVSHAMMDPERRTDPGMNFDWEGFRALVVDGAAAEIESAVSISGFEDVVPLAELEANARGSVCAHAVETEAAPAEIEMEAISAGMATTIDWRGSHRLALASQAVYGSAEDAQSWAKVNLNANKATFVSQADTQVLIAETARELFIIYRGSQQLGDWIANMKIKKVRRPYGRVHRGFLGSFLDVETEVMEALKGARRLGKDIYLAGHSLGGALAVITAAEAQSRFGMIPLKGIYTYGMPRSCDAACAEHMTRTLGPLHYRFVNHRDIVTRIPPFSYHTGRLIHFDRSGDLQITEETEAIGFDMDGTEETPLTDSEFEMLQAGLAPLAASQEGQIIGAADHAIAQYIDCIAARIGH